MIKLSWQQNKYDTYMLLIYKTTIAAHPFQKKQACMVEYPVLNTFNINDNKYY